MGTQGRPVGTPKALVDMSRYQMGVGGNFDLSADGTRILTVALREHRPGHLAACHAITR